MSELALNNSLFSHLEDKAIVDFIQGMTVASHQIKYKKERESLTKRILDGLSGKTEKRNTQTKENLLNGLNGCQVWLKELTKQSIDHSQAICLCQYYLKNQQEQFGSFLDSALDFKQEFDLFKNNINEIANNHEQRILKLESNDKSTIHFNHLFSMWESEKLNHFSALQKIFYVINELYWGDYFYNYKHSPLQEKQKLNEILVNKIISCLKLDRIERNDILHREDWIKLTRATNSTNDHQLLTYMGDFSLDNPNKYATTLLATQWQRSEVQKGFNYNVFFLAKPETVIYKLLNENFK